MFLSRFAVKRPITIVMVTLAVLILGYVSFSDLPIDLLPDLEIPVSAVMVDYRGVGPQEVEKLVTIPLEGAVGTVSNIKDIRSISSEGRSIIIAQFNYGSDMDMVALELREKVDMVKSLLPECVGNPMVLKLDPDSIPIVQAAVYGNNDLEELQAFAEDIVKPQLERLEGVAAVDIAGGRQSEVEIRVNPNTLAGYGLSIDMLSSIIAANNLNLPGGIVSKGEQDMTIRTIGEFGSVEDIRNLPLMLPSGQTVTLENVADINLVINEGNSLNRINGTRSIDISIRKQSGSNTVAVAKESIAALELIQAKYTQYQILPVINQADYIQRSINHLAENAVLGCLLAVIVLLLFFRSMSTTLIVAISIPISIIGVFVILYFSGITLNLMTMGGLALAVGMLVDNAIVVLENIFRLREEGLNNIDAAIQGAGEVATAVTASTLTTVAVFLPIVFVEGITSEIFSDLALTVTISLFASLAVSLTLIPMLSSKMIPRKKIKSVAVPSVFEKAMGKVISGYKGLLSAVLNHPGRTFGIGILSFIVCILPLAIIGAEYFPEMDQGQFTISIEQPPGSSLDYAESIATQVESLIVDIPEIDIIYSQVVNTSTDIVVLTQSSDLTSRETSVVADEVRKLIKDIPGVNINVSVASAMMMMGGGLGESPVNISIKGDDLTELRRISNDFVDLVGSVEGTRMVDSSFSQGLPEVQVQINRRQAGQYGLNTAQIANTIRTIMSGKTVTRYKLDDTEINVVIRGEDWYSKSISSLEQLALTTPSGMTIPLSQVADVVLAQGPQTINREGQMRVTTVTSQIFERDLQGVSQDIEALLNQYQLPPGYSYEIGGEYQELVNALSDLSIVLILAVALVYMVLASQFESLLYPFVIMFAVPLSFSGAAIGLLITGYPLSVPVLIGAIILAGVVVNDAIVLVDYINTRRSRGEDRRTAIMNAGPIRLRPIVITTLTTILGLFPMSLGLGAGAEALAPMAITVIFGLGFATLLTLVLIPAIYVVIDNLSEQVTSRFRLKAE